MSVLKLGKHSNVQDRTGVTPGPWLHHGVIFDSGLIFWLMRNVLMLKICQSSGFLSRCLLISPRLVFSFYSLCLVKKTCLKLLLEVE